MKATYSLWKSAVCAMTCSFAMGVTVAPAAAQTHWIGGDGDWNVMENWNNGIPGTGNEAVLDQPGGYTVNYVNPANNPALTLVAVDNDIYVVQTADELTTGELLVASMPGSNGTYEQAGGSVTIDTFLGIGYEAGSNGVYSLSGEALLNKLQFEVQIGAFGTGYFYQDGGTFTFAGALYLGVDSTGHGTYEMYGGVLNNPVNGSGGIVLGEWGGTGDFTQFGGAVYVSDLTLARQDNSTGNYTLTDDATLNVSGEVVVGGGGIGHFNHGGWSTHTPQELIVGAGDYYLIPQNRIGDGTYELHDDALLHVDGATRIGRYGGTGVFNQFGHSTHETLELIVGGEPKEDGSTGSGTYNLNEFARLIVHGNEVIGLAATGTFNQSDEDTLNVVEGDLWIDAGVASKGIYNLSGGTLQADHMAFVGNQADATGEVNQSNGSANITDGLVLGLHPDSTGRVWLDGGTLTTGWTHVASSGYGYFNHTNGYHDTETLVIAAGQAGEGFYDFYEPAGLNVTYNLVVGDWGTGYFNHHGGNLTVGSDLTIGNFPGSFGYFTADGVGQVTVNNGLQVGREGSGSMLLYDGAHVTSAWSELAVLPGGEANVAMLHYGSENNTVWNAGETLVIGGSMDAEGGYASVSLTGAECHLRVVNATNDAGLLLIWTNGSLDIFGGNGRVSVGSETLGTPGRLWVAPGGELRMRGGYVRADLIRVSHGGQLNGHGSLDTQGVDVSGILNPSGDDDETGLLQLTGDCSVDANGILVIHLGGTTAGDDYDRLEVDGFASLQGSLDVWLTDGFTPSLGDSFAFLFAGNGFDASFSAMNLPDLSALGLDWQLNPGGATLFLEIVAGQLIGDLNNDGFVGIADLNIVLGNWNKNVTPGAWLEGDPSGDGYVGIADLNQVLGNWNAGTPPDVNTAIPEPTTITLLLAGSCMLHRRS